MSIHLKRGAAFLETNSLKLPAMDPPLQVMDFHGPSGEGFHGGALLRGSHLGEVSAGEADGGCRGGVARGGRRPIEAAGESLSRGDGRGTKKIAGGADQAGESARDRDNSSQHMFISG